MTDCSSKAAAPSSLAVGQVAMQSQQSEEHSEVSPDGFKSPTLSTPRFSQLHELVLVTS